MAIERKLKTYRGEQRFAADRGLMEAQGWHVRSWRTREQGTLGIGRDLDEPAWSVHALDGPWTMPEVGGGLSYPRGVRGMYGLGRASGGLAVLLVAPFVWLWSKVRSGTKVDVLYERSPGR